MADAPIPSLNPTLTALNPIPKPLSVEDPNAVPTVVTELSLGSTAR